jgi:hypothetical protein
MRVVNSDEKVPGKERPLKIDAATILPASVASANRQEGLDVANMAVFCDALLVARIRVDGKPLMWLGGFFKWFYSFEQLQNSFCRYF